MEINRPAGEMEDFFGVSDKESQNEIQTAMGKARWSGSVQGGVRTSRGNLCRQIDRKKAELARFPEKPNLSSNHLATQR
jgi:hypothetical protein